jgi:NADH-quinone oxidoreductase subunit A
MVVFAVAVFVSFVYLISNGALDWGPARRLRPSAGSAADAGRTSATTVRRVGRDGGTSEEAA